MLPKNPDEEDVFMVPSLLLCLSQDDAAESYQFKITNIKVYFFEEALYHCRHYWKESIDDFLSEEFIDWVRTGLKLKFLASQIQELTTLSSFSVKLIRFLSLTDYFDKADLDGLANELTDWEKRMEWERLKERGDSLMRLNEPSKAFVLYKKALDYAENANLLNNAALALMRLERPNDASVLLEKAYALKPDDAQIRLNLAEARIYDQRFEKALTLLKTAEEEHGPNAHIFYLHGELNLEAGNIRYSIDYFEKAYAIDPSDFYLYRLTDVYVKLRFYEKALENLNKAKIKNGDFFLKQAEVYVAAANVPTAIRCIEKALMLSSNQAELWIRLAMYHRLDYDLNRAYGAILKALNLAPTNDQARLELARIKKAQGKTKEYQKILTAILQGFKKKYREQGQV